MFESAEQAVLLRKAKRLPNVSCKRCRQLFKPKRRTQQYCATTCRNGISHIKWPTNLPKLVAVSSMAAVARELGVSGSSVRLRLIRYHGFCLEFVGKKYKISWPDDLLALVADRSLRSVARELGVSDVALKRRLVKYHGQ